MNQTPQSNRLHIGIFGKCNSGKSSLINAITGQQTAVVSEVPGTTTDLVSKSMEVPGIGSCLFIDTAGFDDISLLGIRRLEQTRKAIDKTDIAIMVYAEMDVADESRWIKQFKDRGIPVIAVINYNKKLIHDLDGLVYDIKRSTGVSPVVVDAKTGEGIRQLVNLLIEENRKNGTTVSITGNLVEKGDVVMLIMPQDAQAPKGRLILPQVQTIRELLDKQCIAVCCTPEQVEGSLKALSAPPKLVITDSQLFGTINKLMPPGSKLTSFSILFAHYKGDIRTFVEGAKTLDKLTGNSKVLIAEACTHTPLNEDIGRVKIPALLHRKVGKGLQIDIVNGSDFPDDLTPYNLVIHCGACMFNRKHVLSRVNKAMKQNVPITNYGIAIAHLTGVLDKLVYPL